MGDKTKMGMDVGHRDNNPMNNDPKNLRNEDPSKNRREPRLREDEDLDEMSWYKELIAKISQMKHPSGYEKMAKAYAAKMREKEYKGKPGHAIADITKLTKNITPRQLAKYINKLVDKGVFPQDLHTEYDLNEFVGPTKSDIQKYYDHLIRKGQNQPVKATEKALGIKSLQISDRDGPGYKKGEVLGFVVEQTGEEFSFDEAKKGRNISSFREFVVQLQEIEEINIVEAQGLSPDTIKRLQISFKKIKRLNLKSPSGKKILQFINDREDDELKNIEKADINHLSKLAKKELKRRGVR